MSYYSFFRVVKPFRVYKLTGTSRTNAHYGTARISQGVYTPTTLSAGDVIGSGGGEDLRLVVGRDAVPVRLSPPADPFERTRGPGADWALDQKMKAGDLEKIDEPEGLNFRSGSFRQYPDNHPNTTESRSATLISRMRSR